MPSPADEPISRCDINLFTVDKEWLARRYGHGWSEQVRKLVREFIKQKEAERG